MKKRKRRQSEQIMPQSAINATTFMLILNYYYCDNNHDAQITAYLLSLFLSTSSNILSQTSSIFSVTLILLFFLILWIICEIKTKA